MTRNKEPATDRVRRQLFQAMQPRLCKCGELLEDHVSLSRGEVCMGREDCECEWFVEAE